MAYRAHRGTYPACDTNGGAGEIDQSRAGSDFTRALVSEHMRRLQGGLRRNTPDALAGHR